MVRSILLVLHDFSLGGTERICLRLARAWSELGTQVTVFAGNPAGPLRHLAGAKVEVVVAAPSIARQFGSRLRLAAAAADYLKQHPADACFLPGNYHWPAAPKLAKVAHQQDNIVVAQISAALRKPQRQALRQSQFDFRMKQLLRRCDGLVAMSPEAKRQAAHIVGGPVEVIPLPALDDDLPPPSALPQGPPLILAAGRLVPEKGFAELIAAFGQLPARNIRLAIAGAGPEEAQLKAQAAELGVADRVSFLGYVEDLRPALDKANLFVMPSKFEGFGAVVIEALAAGRPVVMTDCSPAADLVKQSGAGQIVAVDDVDELRAAIAAMLRMQASPNPHHAAEAVAQYRLGTGAQRYLEFFGRLRAARIGG